MTEKKCFTVQEWESRKIENVTLGPEDEKITDLLEKSGRISIKPYSNGVFVETGSYVGTVSLSSFDLAINPKFEDYRQFFKLIGYSLNLEDFQFLDDYVDTSLTISWITDVLAATLVKEINKILVKGLLKRYREKEEALSSPRGKIDFNSLANNYGRGTISVFCRYEDLSYDVLENRALLAALNLVCPLISSPTLFARAKYLSQLLSEEVCADNNAGFLLKELEKGVDRLGFYYQKAIELCISIFRSMVFTFEGEGGSIHPAFLFNMAELFEKFLARLLSECAPTGYLIKYQSGIGGYFNIAEGRSSALRPDFHIYWKDKLVFIADAKYKLYDQRKVDSGDLNQLTVYQMLGKTESAVIYYPSQAGNSNNYELRKADGNCLLHNHVVGIPMEAILTCINNRGMIEKTSKEYIWDGLALY